MAKQHHHPVANGVSTDHPVPDLPFVEDSHVPLDDPAAIEAIGRHDGAGTWGRRDSIITSDGQEVGWAAFTTDATRTDLAWVVRWHPEHGRSVLLYRDGDSSSIHSDYTTIPALLQMRAGGYWWDGTTWYRPLQIWDRAAERYLHRPVPAARTITAADLLDPGADPRRARIQTIGDFDPDRPGSGRWADDLALWARHRGQHRPQAGPLTSCMVNVTAPELTGEQLVGIAEMAAIAGVAASTVRAYVARGEGDIPQPQAIVAGRNAWARPVAEEWAERRRHSDDNAAAAVSSDRIASASIPAGIDDAWASFTRMFYSRLWENPARRRLWALRWRTQDTVRDVAEELAWSAAANITTIVPTGDLAVTIEHAILGDFAVAQARYRDDPDTTPGDVMYFVMPHVAKMLDWLVRHEPHAAVYVIGEIIGAAESRLAMDRATIEETLHTALHLDSKLPKEDLKEFLSRAFSPSR